MNKYSNGSQSIGFIIDDIPISTSSPLIGKIENINALAVLK